MASDPLPRLHRFIEFINSGNTDIGKEVISDSAIFHVPFGPEPLKGLDGYLRVLGMMRGAFPDINWTLQETGPFMGVPASGKDICMTALNIYRFDNGKIAEERGQPDIFGLMVQIGAIPVPGP
ncbi:unnamed protein product [Alternaria alternata]